MQTPPEAQHCTQPERGGAHVAAHCSLVVHGSTHIPPPPPQRPAVHDWPAGHALPQEPQLALLDCVSTQLVPHIVLGAVQPPARHMPIWQVWPEGHIRPHIPQLALSALTSTHRPPHAIWPPVHIIIGPSQRPMLHICGALQRELHAPQCTVDVLRFTQSVPQRTAPVGQPPPVPLSMPESTPPPSVRTSARASRGSSISRLGPQATRTKQAAAPSNQGERMGCVSVERVKGGMREEYLVGRCVGKLRTVACRARVPSRTEKIPGHRAARRTVVCEVTRVS